MNEETLNEMNIFFLLLITSISKMFELFYFGKDLEMGLSTFLIEILEFFPQ